jgi:hypothetical protein
MKFGYDGPDPEDFEPMSSRDLAIVALVLGLLIAAFVFLPRYL